MLAGWPDTTFKHEVELLRLADFIVGVWISYVVCPAELAQLWATVVVKLKRQSEA